MKSYLLDSVILIDHFNGQPETTQFLLENRDSAAISIITRAEVLTGSTLWARYRPKPFSTFFELIL